MWSLGTDTIPPLGSPDLPQPALGMGVPEPASPRPTLPEEPPLPPSELWPASLTAPEPPLPLLLLLLPPLLLLVALPLLLLLLLVPPDPEPPPRPLEVPALPELDEPPAGPPLELLLLPDEEPEGAPESPSVPLAGEHPAIAANTTSAVADCERSLLARAKAARAQTV